MFQFDKENIRWIKDERGLPSCYYRIKIPSVSTILSEMVPDPDFEQWVLRIGKEKAEQIMTVAANRGSSMHLFIENFIIHYHQTKDVSKALKYTQEESPKNLITENIPAVKIEEGRDLFYKFYYSDYAQQFSEMIAVEMGIFSASLFYRGKLDILYKDRNFGLSLTDFKSSNGKIKKGSVKELKYKLQLGGYALALDEMYKEKNIIINRASILCVDKQSDILQEIESVGKELAEYKEKFKELVVQYHIKNNTEYLINDRE
jgi:hypothetical protein